MAGTTFLLLQDILFIIVFNNWTQRALFLVHNYAEQIHIISALKYFLGYALNIELVETELPSRKQKRHLGSYPCQLTRFNCCKLL